MFDLQGLSLAVSDNLEAVDSFESGLRILLAEVIVLFEDFGRREMGGTVLFFHCDK